MPLFTAAECWAVLSLWSCAATNGTQARKRMTSLYAGFIVSGDAYGFAKTGTPPRCREFPDGNFIRRSDARGSLRVEDRLGAADDAIGQDLDEVVGVGVEKRVEHPGIAL